MSVVPRRLFEGWIPSLAILLEQQGRLFAGVGINCLYERGVNVVIPLIDVLAIRQDFLQQIFIERVVSGVTSVVQKFDEYV